jgi:hypothetical protein
VGGSTLALPYVYGDWGRFFGRIDTFGVRTVPVGCGHLEVVARISTAGFDADVPALRGLRDRGDPVPVALYPLLGIEYRSGAYVRHLYGIDARSMDSGHVALTYAFR